MIKNRIYTNNAKGDIIYRLDAFIGNGNSAFVTNIRELKTYVIRLEELNDYYEITKDYMLSLVNVDIPDFRSLSIQQQKLARKRYAIISVLLDNLHHEQEYVNKMVEELSSLHKVSVDDIWTWLSCYCAYGSISCLVKPDETKCSLKPVLKVREFSSRFKETSHALLLTTKLTPVGENKQTWLTVLIDSETHYILSHNISTEEDNFNSIKSTLHRCLSNNDGKLPHIITAQVTSSTWNGLFRDLQLLNVQTYFAHLTLEDDLEFKRLTNSLKAFCRGIKNIDVLKSRVKALVNAYNNDSRRGVPYKELYNGLLTAVPDSYIRANDNELEKVLSTPYKTLLKQVFAEK